MKKQKLTLSRIKMDVELLCMGDGLIGRMTVLEAIVMIPVSALVWLCAGMQAKLSDTTLDGVMTVAMYILAVSVSLHTLLTCLIPAKKKLDDKRRVKRLVENRFTVVEDTLWKKEKKVRPRHSHRSILTLIQELRHPPHPHQLFFSKYGKYELPEQEMYLSDEENSMNDDAIFGTAEPGDGFYLVVFDGGEITMVYNKKYFELDD